MGIFDKIKKNNEKKATIIFLEDGLILSKKVYKDWKEIQDEYYDKYKTSFPPMTCNEIMEYFEDDYKYEQDWPFSRKTIIDFFESEQEIIKSE